MHLRYPYCHHHPQWCMHARHACWTHPPRRALAALRGRVLCRMCLVRPWMLLTWPSLEHVFESSVSSISRHCFEGTNRSAVVSTVAHARPEVLVSWCEVFKAPAKNIQGHRSRQLRRKRASALREAGAEGQHRATPTRAAAPEAPPRISDWHVTSIVPFRR